MEKAKTHSLVKHFPCNMMKNSTRLRQPFDFSCALGDMVENRKKVECLAPRSGQNTVSDLVASTVHELGNCAIRATENDFTILKKDFSDCNQQRIIVAALFMEEMAL
jgi:hypothetical protein